MATRLDDKTPLGKLILKKLYLKGKNQAWLAEQIQVNPNHISILCTKVRCPKIDTLLKISKALDMEVSELYTAISENVEKHDN